jgi:hypothetical protein
VLANKCGCNGKETMLPQRCQTKNKGLVDFVTFISKTCALMLVCVMASYDNGDSSPETAAPRGGTPRQPRAASRQNKTLDQF